MILFLKTLLLLTPLQVERVEVQERRPYLDGRAFGAIGSYEHLSGVIHFALDPEHPQNSKITDLAKATRNSRGAVQAHANFEVLQATDPRTRSGVALLEVSNRGGKAALRYFNDVSRGDDEAGDGLLMRLGLTVIWVGWQFDVPEHPGTLRLSAPSATAVDQPLRGYVRSDWTLDAATDWLALGHRRHRAYAPLGPASLTVRKGRESLRELVSPESWQFEERLQSGKNVYGIRAVNGFDAGKIYELIYQAQDPVVVGYGLAAIRDTISYAKNNPDCPFPVEQGIALGISQTGRFLRHFLYQGFNVDTEGRRALDGMLILTAGAGRGSFNHRFAQPSRDAHRYSAFFYPTDLFPFTGLEQTDSQTGKTDGILTHYKNQNHIPKIFYINTGYEYWGRAAALIHTTPDGREDAPLHPRERIYHIASGQHFVSGWGRRTPNSLLFRRNPLNFFPTYRALLVRMLNWVQADEAPPSSRHPKIATKELVSMDNLEMPAIPGLKLPKAAHTAYRVDYGPQWPQGIVSQQPPDLGPAFPSLIPQVDSIGNELGGIRNVAIEVPLGTYLPWHVRIGLAGGNGEMTDFIGTFVPLLSREIDSESDSRPRLEDLYADRNAYMKRCQDATGRLVQSGFLLEEDVDEVMERAGNTWNRSLEIQGALKE